MTEFILNNQSLSTEIPGNTTLLDFIRYEENLKGTKIGCREGDCGACTVLVGNIENGDMKYMSATSCLTPLANVHGKHVVTVEGLNTGDLNEVQKAMVECSGTQCGFCTPGFITSLCGFAIECKNPDISTAISSIDGNICRCTGYKSIEKAAAKITDILSKKDRKNPVEWLIKQNFIPEYFLGIRSRLKEIKPEVYPDGSVPIGGGTDLFVQKHDEIHDYSLHYMFNERELQGISFKDNVCIIKASTTVTELMNNVTLQQNFKGWHTYLKLVSSTPIRNIATVAGNIVNASPIGDLTIIFMALDASVTLIDGNRSQRKIALKDFYAGYKKLVKKEDETVSEIIFTMPLKTTSFNFEKVSKRMYLDIASVNSSISMTTENSVMDNVHCSIGGVGPIPMYLHNTSEFLKGQTISHEVIKQAASLLQEEISPISDVRGHEQYKRLLARQLFFSHFISLFPEQINMEKLL